MYTDNDLSNTIDKACSQGIDLFDYLSHTGGPTFFHKPHYCDLFFEMSFLMIKCTH